MTLSRKRAAPMRKARDKLIEKLVRTRLPALYQQIEVILEIADAVVRQDRRMRARTKEK